MSGPARTARRGLFWALVAATLAVYAVMVLWSLPRITQVAGGLLPFDLRPLGYGLDEATAFVAALDAEARAFYLGPQHSLDMVYPALLGATLIWTTIWALGDWPSVLRVALILPAAAGAVFDWIENSRVAVLLQAEALTAEAVAAASFATVAKSLATSAAMAILLAGLALHAMRWWKGKL